MEIKDLINPLIRWWWLLIAATLIAGIQALWLPRESPIYEASTTLMVGQAIANPNPSGGEFQLSQQLSALYSDIAERDPVAIATMNSLGIDGSLTITLGALPNSQFMEIEVVDTSSRFSGGGGE